MKTNKQFFTLLGLSLVIVRNSKGEYLTVLENDDRGWWLPGGRVDPPENYYQAAIRETKEEASIDIELLGILRTEMSISSHQNLQRFKVIFFAKPINENQLPKHKADSESQLAKWIPEKELKRISPWRGPELLQWVQYLENGGEIYPLSTLAEEGSDPIINKAFTLKDVKFK